MTSRSAAIALLVVGAALFIAHSGFFFFRDNFTTHYPLKVISAQSFRAGEIPWWNFHDFGGQPLAGNPNSLTFYPDNILYRLLPAHVAFNLHFLIHLMGGFAAMRGLCLARGLRQRDALAGGAIWVLSGVAISATAFYNLVTGVALVPIALLGVERRSAPLLGCAFGLLILGNEPMTVLGTALAVAIAGFGRVRWTIVAAAVLIAAAIGSPQILAYSEIAGEVERSVPISSRAMLATSLTWSRVAEIFVWPLRGFLNDPGGDRARLFSTMFLGVIAVPALFARSRYTAIAIALLLLALGSTNPLVSLIADSIPPPLRAFRFPEKLVLPAVAAFVVLIAAFLSRTRFRRAWLTATLLPLLWTTYRALPVDWFDFYHAAPRATVRVHWTPTVRAGSLPARAEYRKRAAMLDWMFGATANLRYGVGRSPDLMHSLMSRAVADRYQSSNRETRARYLRVNGCDVPGALPMAMIVPKAVGAGSLVEAVRELESPAFDEQTTAVAPSGLGAFRSAPAAITRYLEDGQTIRIGVRAAGPALLMVNQTFFEAWVARSGNVALETLPLNVDRLGVIVPRGEHDVQLTFGRRRTAVVIAWIASLLLLLGSALRGVIQKFDRRAGEVERATDEHRAVRHTESGIER